MLGTYSYHEIFRKTIVAFGTLFNNIELRRTNEVMKVPLAYGPKQKFLARLDQNADPTNKRVQITLPRISFEINSMNYDSSRKVSPTQKIVVKSLGGQAVLSDISDIAKKFNNGQADIMAAPAYAYKPLELDKGLGNDGAIITFPAVNMTMDLIIRPDKFSSNFGENSRAWFLSRSLCMFMCVSSLAKSRYGSVYCVSGITNRSCRGPLHLKFCVFPQPLMLPWVLLPDEQ